MKHWRVLKQEQLYTSRWVNLRKDHVQLPDGTIIGHHVVDYPKQAVGVLPVRDDGHVLMIKNYRFITDTEAWELPAGMIDDGETVEAAAQRELLEETGYAARALTYFSYYYPSNGSGNQTFHMFAASGIEQRTPEFDTNEILELGWFSPEQIRAMILNREIVDGLCLTLLFFGELHGVIRF